MVFPCCAQYQALKKADLSSNPSFRSLELFSDIPYIDFHYENSDKDYTSRIYERSPGVIDISAELLQKGKRVIICENDTISFRNESGYLMGRIGSLDLGSIISIAGHRMKFLWNGELQRIYVHMDGAQLGYINLLK